MQAKQVVCNKDAQIVENIARLVYTCKVKGAESTRYKLIAATYGFSTLPQT